MPFNYLHFWALLTENSVYRLKLLSFSWVPHPCLVAYCLSLRPPPPLPFCCCYQKGLAILVFLSRHSSAGHPSLWTTRRRQQLALGISMAKSRAHCVFFSSVLPFFCVSRLLYLICLQLACWPCWAVAGFWVSSLLSCLWEPISANRAL